jgi:hypothetical protein
VAVKQWKLWFCKPAVSITCSGSHGPFDTSGPCARCAMDTANVWNYPAY